jgi:hypothetical protein
MCKDHYQNESCYDEILLFLYRSARVKQEEESDGDEKKTRFSS